jgi:hypothetical protein
VTDSNLPAVVHPEAPELTPFEVMEKVITSGDLAAMQPQERVAFYWRTCESLGLNPLTRPFDFIRDREGRLTMYARKDATDQLRRINGVSVVRLDAQERGDLATVTAYVVDKSKRQDSAFGAVSIKGLGGEALANAWMKAETKAKRRATLSLVGLGFLDESEAESVGAVVDFDPETGAVDEAKPPPKSLVEAVEAQAERLATTVETTSAPEGEASTTPATDDGASAVLQAEPEAAILTEPMPVEVSAQYAVDDDEEEEGDVEPTPIRAPAGPGLTVSQLADLARAANIGKLRFASELDVVPADVSKRIEDMSDEQRHALALRLGLIE